MASQVTHAYCRGCGTDLGRGLRLTRDPTAPVLCSACRGRLVAGARFCPRCGADVPAPSGVGSPRLPTLPPPAKDTVRRAGVSRAVALPALLLGPLILAGVLAPFATLRGESESLRYGGAWWFWTVPATVAIGGSVAVLLGRREGIGAAAGVGLLHLAVAGSAFHAVWPAPASDHPGLHGRPALHVGGFAWALAMVVATVLVVQALLGSRRTPDRDTQVPPAAVSLVLAGGGLLAIGRIVPSGPTSVHAHVFAGDVWTDVLTLALIAAAPATALLLMMRADGPAAYLVAGATSWYAVIWWFDARDLEPSGSRLVAIRSGEFAWTTAGLALLALGALVGLSGRSRSGRRATGYPHTLALAATVACAVLLAAGIRGHLAAAGRPAFGGSDPGPSYRDLPYDESLGPLATECYEGGMRTCDALYAIAVPGNAFESFGSTCSGSSAPRPGLCSGAREGTP